MLLVRLLPPPIALLLLLIGSGGPVYAAVCAGTDAAPALCPPGTGPCVVSTICTLPSGFVADLGARPLVIQANKTITIPEPGVIAIKANGITLEGGAKLLAEGAGTPNVRLVSTSTTTGISMDISSRITTGSRGDGGVIDLISDGPVVMRGSLRAPGPNAPDVGGDVSILAQGDVRIEGAGSGIDVSGGLDGFGGYIDVSTLGTVTIQSALKLDGGEGGSLTIDTEGNVDVEAGTLIDVDATLGGGYGGEVDITGQDVQVAGTVEGTAKREDDGSNDPTFSGGDGAAVSILANGNLAVDGTFDIKGGPGGTGGDFELDAIGNVSLLGKVVARAEGKYGSGGDSVTIWSEEGDVTVGATIDAAGGWSGGSIEITSFSPDGGTVTLTGSANLGAAAIGLPADNPFGGTIDLDSCSVQIQAGAALSTAGLQGVTSVFARSSMVIAGSMRAGLENRLVYRDQPSIISILSPAGQIVPAPKLIANPTMTCCGAACVPPSTTTTTAPPTTTTSLPPTTSTTSLPPTTSTTLPPSTTTTSLPETTSTTSTTTSTSSSSLPTSTTVVTTTSTTVEPATSTSTTQPSTQCSADTTEFGGVACSVTRLTTRIEGATTDQLGGKATANRLRAALRRASRYLDAARSGKNVTGNLRRAQREMRTFERTVQQGLGRKRRPIDTEVGQGILSLSTETRSEIGVLQALGQ